MNRTSGILIALVSIVIVVFTFGIARSQTQAEINAQVATEYKQADTQLNVVYKRLLGHVGSGQKRRIVAAEQAWIKFRDANCEAEAYQMTGGSMYPTVWAGCATRMTKARTAELQALLSQLQSNAPEISPSASSQRCGACSRT